MQDSTYSALFGALSNEMRMSSIANNLANVNTSAYKKDTMAFHDSFIRFAHDYLVDGKTFIRGKDMFPEANVLAKARLSSQQVDFSQGGMQPTGNQLDFAISGPGFFTVEGDGGDLYTRSGSFVTDSEGILRTEDGYAVMVDGGELTIPDGAKVNVTSDGTISVNGEVVGGFDIINFANLADVERVGGNKYRVPDGTVQADLDDSTQVVQGFLEKGNVEVVTEMVSMIEVQRAFTLYTQMIQSTNDNDTKLITQVGRPTM